MHPSASRDLGSGVRLMTLADGSLLVSSQWLPLPWSVRAGRTTGTAVLIGGDAFEVVAHSSSTRGDSWSLEAWPEDEAMRGVVTLDEAWISRCAQDVIDARRASRLRLWLLPVAPVLGSTPASLQSAWASRWGFPAVVATLLSALSELGVAALGIIHTLSSSLGGSGLLPSWLGWLGLVAPVLAIESVVRLKHVAALHEPIGTALLLPLSALRPRQPTPATAAAPEVTAVDPERGALRVRSPIHRADWVLGGLLAYRDEVYELSSVEREGRAWVYLFARPDHDVSGPALRLGPPHRGSAPAVRERPPSVVRVALVSAAACMAPRDLQETWAARIDVPAVLLTVLGAGVECCGSLVNLATADGAGASWWLPVNLFFLAEGTIRFGLMIRYFGPVGSLPGRAFRPFLERLMTD